MLLQSLVFAALIRSSTPADLKIDAPDTVDVCASSWTSPVDVKIELPKGATGTVAWTANAPEADKTTVVSTGADSARIYMNGWCESSEGESTLEVTAKIGTSQGSKKIKLKKGQAKVLLVDDDRTENNSPDHSSFLSESDRLFRHLLRQGDGRRSLAYDVFAVEKRSSGPGVDQMKKYDTIIWYTGGEYGGQRDNAYVLSNMDVQNLSEFLTLGKTVIIFSPGFINNYQGYVKAAKSNEEKWNKSDSTFIIEKMGLKGGRGLLHRFYEVDVKDANGKKFHLRKGKPLETDISPINQKNAKPLMFAFLNPDLTGDKWVPCATANITKKGSVVYVGFSFENIESGVETAFQILVTPALGWGDIPADEPKDPPSGQ